MSFLHRGRKRRKQQEAQEEQNRLETQAQAQRVVAQNQRDANITQLNTSCTNARAKITLRAGFRRSKSAFHADLSNTF